MVYCHQPALLWSLRWNSLPFVDSMSASLPREHGVSSWRTVLVTYREGSFGLKKSIPTFLESSSVVFSPKESPPGVLETKRGWRYVAIGTNVLSVLTLPKIRAPPPTWGRVGLVSALALIFARESWRIGGVCPLF